MASISSSLGQRSLRRISRVTTANTSRSVSKRAIAHVETHPPAAADQERHCWHGMDAPVEIAGLPGHGVAYKVAPVVLCWIAGSKRAAHAVAGVVAGEGDDAEAQLLQRASPALPKYSSAALEPGRETISLDQRLAAAQSGAWRLRAGSAAAITLREVAELLVQLVMAVTRHRACRPGS